MNNLKAIREQAGYKSAAAFARHIGMPANTYRNYESDSRSMSLDVACRICENLDCTLDELIGENAEYTADEAQLIAYFRTLPEDGKQAVLSGLKEFAQRKGADNGIV